MHAGTEKNITDEDIKKLNKFMVNRLADVFLLIIENRWFELNFLIESIDKMYVHDWNTAEPDDGGSVKRTFKSFIGIESKYFLI